MTRPPSSDEDDEEDVVDMEVDTPAVQHTEEEEAEPAAEEDVRMEDAPLPPFSIKQHQLIQQRGPLSSVIAATKRIALDTSPEEVVMESPADAPGSGKRQRMHDVSPVVGSSALLHRVLADLNDSSPTRQGANVPPSSSPVERRVRTRIRRSEELRKMSEGVGSNASQTARSVRRSSRLSGSSSSVVAPEEDGERAKALEAVEEEPDMDVEGEEDGEEMEIEESAIGQIGEDEMMDEPINMEPEEEPEPEEREEPEPEEAQEINEKEAAQRLGRKRPPRGVAAASPELDTAPAAVESPAGRKRRRKEIASPAAQQQPAKKARSSRAPPPLAPPQPVPEPQERTRRREKATPQEPLEPEPEPQEGTRRREKEKPQEPQPPEPETQERAGGREKARPQEPIPPPKPREKPRPQEKTKPQAKTKSPERAKPQEPTKSKPKPRKQPTKRKPKQTHDGEEDGEGGKSGFVSVTVQRFTKPPRVSEAGGEDGVVIPDTTFGNRAGVNAIDVLSKLCEELADAYTEKLQEAAMASEDSATRREKKTMLRTLEAFREELRTRLLEHVSLPQKKSVSAKPNHHFVRPSLWTPFTPCVNACAQHKKRNWRYEMRLCV